MTFPRGAEGAGLGADGAIYFNNRVLEAEDDWPFPLWGNLRWDSGHTCRQRFSPDPAEIITELTTLFSFSEAQG